MDLMIKNYLENIGLDIQILVKLFPDMEYLSDNVAFKNINILIKREVPQERIIYYFFHKSEFLFENPDLFAKQVDDFIKPKINEQIKKLIIDFGIDDSYIWQIWPDIEQISAEDALKNVEILLNADVSVSTITSMIIQNPYFLDYCPNNLINKISNYGKNLDEALMNNPYFLD